MNTFDDDDMPRYDFDIRPYLSGNVPYEEPEPKPEPKFDECPFCGDKDFDIKSECHKCHFYAGKDSFRCYDCGISIKASHNQCPSCGKDYSMEETYRPYEDMPKSEGYLDAQNDERGEAEEWYSGRRYK